METSGKAGSKGLGRTKISVWLIVREERHIDNKFWVCITEQIALELARQIAAYWAKEYPHSGLDETLYEGLLFNCSAEDAFRVYVKKQIVKVDSNFKKSEA